MTNLERIVETCLLLAPHRQVVVLRTGFALLELQMNVDSGWDGEAEM